MSEGAIKLVKKAGGSVIDHKPLFSSNSKILYVGCGPVLRLFSTETGEHLQDVEISAIALDKPEGSIVDVLMHPFDKTILIICFEEGRVIAWSSETNTVVSNLVLNIKNDRVVRMKLYVSSEESETFDVIVGMKKFKQTSIRLCIFDYATGILKCEIPKRFSFLMHSWSVTERGGKDFLAGIDSDKLIIYNLKTNKINKKDIKTKANRPFVCVVCHPEKECVAVGDSTGRILLYYDFLEENKASPYTVYHWHTLAPNDVIFTTTGNVFYSGGNEHVLVKWMVDAPSVRYFLPRVASPIVHLTSSPDSQLIAMSTLDNGISIVNSQNKIQCTLQQFTWGFVSTPGQKLFPSGLVIDSRSNCIVMNGKPGHIQFYSPQYMSLIYNMDIVCQNYVAQERSKHISNAEVVAVEFSSDGIWLATAQMRDDPNFYSDTLLKFWLFDRKSQTYKLTSCITLQHSVSKLCFQPLDEDSTVNDVTEYVFAALCSDKKFRLWSCQYSFKNASASWNCFSIGFYRDHSLQDLCFSGDGSLLGAAFGPCLTLWDSETHSMKCSLSKGPKPLRQVIFAYGDSSFIAVVATNSIMYAWNLLSLTLLWSVELTTSFIVADPRSEHIAAFTPTNSLFIYKASSADHIYERQQLCENDVTILSAIFFPLSNDIAVQTTNPKASWLLSSSLFFFTSSQELMAFEFQSKDVRLNDGLAFVSEKAAATPFKTLMASQTASAVEKKEIKTYLQLGVPWAQTISQFVNLPAHAMPPVHLLCEPFLQSLVLTKHTERLEEVPRSSCHQGNRKKKIVPYFSYPVK